MKLFVDDERQPPDNTWVVLRHAENAIAYISGRPCDFGHVTHLSLDHDLGENVPTGYDVAAWLEEAVFTQGVVPPMMLRVHSANPVGRARILQTFQSIARYCEQNQMQVPKIEG